MLEKCLLFSGLCSEHIIRLEAISKKIMIKKGELLFSPGEATHGFFVVLTGAIRLYRISAKGNRDA